MSRRRTSRVARTPDSGYKFECQACQDEVYQTAQPELVFELTQERGVIVSTPLQCCEDCAEDIKEENAKLTKRRKDPIRQVRELRDATELEGAIPANLKQAAENTTDAKLDKVLDALAALTNLMAAQMQSQITREIFPPVKVVAPVDTKSVMEPPKPKRKILAPPVKASAKSSSKKPEKPVAKAAAKSKSSTSRTAKPRSRRSR